MISKETRDKNSSEIPSRPTGVFEMTVEPSPQWMKDAGKEIQEKYNLDYVEKVYITGIIARHYRLNNSKI